MRLKKELNFFDIFSIATGAMISSGIFVLPGTAFTQAGPAIILSYLLAGILMIPSIFSQAELATAMPKSGGTYFYIERSLGPFAGTLSGLANWYSIALKSAFALIGIGAFVKIFQPEISYQQIKFISIGFCFIFTMINFISVKHTGRLQSFFVVGLLLVLGIYSIIGTGAINIRHFIPFNPFGLKAVLGTAGMIFISYGGITKIASISEEVKNPGKNIPYAMLISFLIVMILYLFVVSVTVGLVPPQTLKDSLIPLALGARALGSKVMLILTALAGLAAYVTTANAGILTASRSPMAMSKDNLMPPFFSKLHPRFKTPYISIFLTSLIMILLIMFLDLTNLVKLASTLMLLLFIFVNFAVIIMRESNIKSYRPRFKSPLYPYLQIFSIISYFFLIAEMGMLPLGLTIIFLFLGSNWYFFYVKDKVKKRDYAIIHLVKRITAKELIDTRLENELRDIIWERDDISEDRFDTLIKQAYILDIKKRMDYKSYFKHISKILCSRLKTDPSTLYGLFLKREHESSTVLKEGLAIPHIITEGKGKFVILLTRSKPGIKFPHQKRPVRIVFVLVGSADERNFHLKALMSIAQIVQGTNFEKDWLNVQNIDQMKNVILLSSRDREKKTIRS
ncbi:MAG: amino acid permease [Spirochaetes bacterium]|nr:amino acid permease [Spirochaetota bacterium]